jgi:hypothetical protein
MKKKEIFKEVMSERDIENFDGEVETFFDGASYKEDYNKALKFAKKTGGELYTMCDGERNKTIYEKGLHWVNRFGFCVLWKKGKIK